MWKIWIRVFLEKSYLHNIRMTLAVVHLNLHLQMFNPNEPGLFGPSRSRGGVECARRSFWAISSLFFITNQPNKVSNESWHLYLPVESLNTILSCTVLPWDGTEVDYFDRGNFLHNFWKFVIFRPTWTICISKKIEKDRKRLKKIKKRSKKTEKDRKRTKR